MTEEQAKQVLIEWVESCRHSLAVTARSIGLPTSVRGAFPIVKDVKDNGKGYTVQHAEKQMSAMTVYKYGWALLENVKLEMPDSVRTAVKFLYDKYGAKCEFHAFVVQSPLAELLTEKNPTFRKSPVEWLLGHAFGPVMLEYVHKIKDLNVSEHGVVKELVDDAVNFMAQDKWQVIAQIPVAGLITKSQLTSGNVTLRSLTSEEMGYWIGDEGSLSTFKTTRMFPTAFAKPLVTTHVIEITSDWSKTEQPLIWKENQGFMMALQLLGFKPGSYEFGETLRKPEWAATGKSGVPTGLSRDFEAKRITTQYIRKAQEIAKKIPQGAVGIPTSSAETALHRFHLGMRRDNPVDKLLDFTISLEAVLLPKISHELSYRFRVNGALWIASTKMERATIEKELEEIYTTRSNIVHGESFPDRERLEILVKKAQELSRRAILKALSDTWPSAATFKKLVIG